MIPAFGDAQGLMRAVPPDRLFGALRLPAREVADCQRRQALFPSTELETRIQSLRGRR